MIARVRETPRRPHTLWSWAVAVFALHSAAVLALIKVSAWNRFGTLGDIADSLLKVGEFWVYRWIGPLFNTPALANTYYRISQFFGVSSLEGFGQLFDFWMFTIFGGPAYALVVVAVTSFRRTKERRHELGSSVA